MGGLFGPAAGKLFPFLSDVDFSTANIHAIFISRNSRASDRFLRRFGFGSRFSRSEKPEKIIFPRLRLREINSLPNPARGKVVDGPAE